MSKESEQIFNDYIKPVYKNLERYVLNLTFDRALAKDIINDTLIIALENFANIKDKKKVLFFMFGTASKIYKRICKKNIRNVSIDAVSEVFISSGSTDSNYDIQFLYESLAKLPPEQKDAIILFDIMGYAQSEIAEIQAVSVNNVKVRIHRGKQKLAQIMGVKNE
ncbi:MAG: polymerase, sigma-24 subunit, subfamily [Ignavibacteria bacterium]|nr:polymerase, sigma-24 subunit, subfamily [Ignavibacteria bacterium]